MKLLAGYERVERAVSIPELVEIERSMLQVQQYLYVDDALDARLLLASIFRRTVLRAENTRSRCWSLSRESFFSKRPPSARSLIITLVLVGTALKSNASPRLASSQYLRKRLQITAEEEGLAAVFLPAKYCTDNGAMIA